MVRLTRPNPLATSTTRAEASDVIKHFHRVRRLAYNDKNSQESKVFEMRHLGVLSVAYGWVQQTFQGSR